MMSAGEDLGAAAFDAGMRAVLDVVLGNQPLITAGAAGLTSDEMDALRWLRQKVHGKKAHEWVRNRPRPKGMGSAVYRVHADLRSKGKVVPNVR